MSFKFPSLFFLIILIPVIGICSERGIKRQTIKVLRTEILFAQAIKGRFTGRGTGIIDTIHLMEVAQSILAMEKANLPVRNPVIRMN